MSRLGGKVRLYDFETGYAVSEFDGYETIDFLLDNHTVVLSNYNSTILVDFPELSELLVRMRKRFKEMPLTVEEKREYYLLKDE